MQDGLAAASTIKGGGSIAFLAQDYAFGRDAVKAAKESLAMVGSKATVVHEEYAPQNTTDFTAAAADFRATEKQTRTTRLANRLGRPQPMVSNWPI